jgi:hypothetical protein
MTKTNNVKLTKPTLETLTVMAQAILRASGDTRPWGAHSVAEQQRYERMAGAAAEAFMLWQIRQLANEVFDRLTHERN